MSGSIRKATAHISMAGSVISYLVFIALLITDLVDQDLFSLPKYSALAVCIVFTFTAAFTDRGEAPILKGLSLVEFFCLLGAWTLGLVPNLAWYFSPLLPAALTVIFYLLGRWSTKRLEATIDVLQKEKIELQIENEKRNDPGVWNPMTILVLAGLLTYSKLERKL